MEVLVAHVSKKNCQQQKNGTAEIIMLKVQWIYNTNSMV